jgi:hypothetical protein
MRQEGKQQEHKNASYPDQKIQSYFRGVDFLFIHATTLLTGGR